MPYFIHALRSFLSFSPFLFLITFDILLYATTMPVYILFVANDPHAAFHYLF
jgi:hypothetical protein